MKKYNWETVTDFEDSKIIKVGTEEVETPKGKWYKVEDVDAKINDLISCYKRRIDYLNEKYPYEASSDGSTGTYHYIIKDLKELLEGSNGHIN